MGALEKLDEALAKLREEQGNAEGAVPLDEFYGSASRRKSDAYWTAMPEDPIKQFTEGGKDVVRGIGVGATELLARAAESGPAIEQYGRPAGMDMLSDVQRFEIGKLIRDKETVEGRPLSEPERNLIRLTYRKGEGEAWAKQARVARDYISKTLKADPEAMKNPSFLGDVIRMGPQVAGQIALTIATGGLGGVVGMGTQIYGDTFANQIAQGVDPDRAHAAAVANALLQAPLEQIGIGNLAKFGKGKAVKVLKGMTQEGLTEFLQTYPEAATEIWGKGEGKGLKKMVDEFVAKFPETTMSGLRQGAVGAVAGGGTAAMLRSTQPTERLMSEGLPEDTEARTAQEEVLKAQKAQKKAEQEAKKEAKKKEKKEKNKKAAEAIKKEPEETPTEPEKKEPEKSEAEKKLDKALAKIKTTEEPVDGEMVEPPIDNSGFTLEGTGPQTPTTTPKAPPKPPAKPPTPTPPKGNKNFTLDGTPKAPHEPSVRTGATPENKKLATKAGTDIDSEFYKELMAGTKEAQERKKSIQFNNLTLPAVQTEDGQVFVGDEIEAPNRNNFHNTSWDRMVKSLQKAELKAKGKGKTTKGFKIGERFIPATEVVEVLEIATESPVDPKTGLATGEGTAIKSRSKHLGEAYKKRAEAAQKKAEAKEKRVRERSREATDIDKKVIDMLVPKLAGRRVGIDSIAPGESVGSRRKMSPALSKQIPIADHIGAAQELLVNIVLDKKSPITAAERKAIAEDPTSKKAVAAINKYRGRLRDELKKWENEFHGQVAGGRARVEATLARGEALPIPKTVGGQIEITPAGVAAQQEAMAAAERSAMATAGMEGQIRTDPTTIDYHTRELLGEGMEADVRSRRTGFDSPTEIAYKVQSKMDEMRRKSRWHNARGNVAKAKAYQKAYESLKRKAEKSNFIDLDVMPGKVKNVLGKERAQRRKYDPAVQKVINTAYAKDVQPGDIPGNAPTAESRAAVARALQNEADAILNESPIYKNREQAQLEGWDSIVSWDLTLTGAKSQARRLKDKGYDNPTVVYVQSDQSFGVAVAGYKGQKQGPTKLYEGPDPIEKTIKAVKKASIPSATKRRLSNQKFTLEDEAPPSVKQVVETEEKNYKPSLTDVVTGERGEAPLIAKVAETVWNIGKKAGDKLSVQMPYENLDAHETGLAAKLMFSRIDRYEKNNEAKMLKLLNKMKELFPKGAKAIDRAYVVFAAERADMGEFLNTIGDETYRKKIETLGTMLRKYFDDAKISYKNRDMDVDYKKRRTAQLRKRLADGQDKLTATEIQDLEAAIQQMEDMEYVHIPYEIMFTKAREAMNKHKKYAKKDQKRKLKLTIENMRRGGTLYDLFISGKLELEDINPFEIMGNYGRRQSKDFALADLRDAALKDGMLKHSKTKPRDGNNWTKIPKELSALGKYMEKADSNVPVGYMRSELFDTLQNTLQATLESSFIDPFIGKTKMWQFVNPIFLPAYDTVQSAMAGNLATIPKIREGLRHVRENTREYQEAAHWGLFSKPYAAPFKEFKMKLDAFTQKSEKGEVSNSLQKMAHWLVRNGNYSKEAAREAIRKIHKGELSGAFDAMDVLDPLYAASWKVAWQLDEGMRMMTFQHFRNKGMTVREAAQAAAEYHADYASVPANTRKGLNRFFFTPTFQIVMGKLYKNMLGEAGRMMLGKVGKKGEAYQKAMVAGIFATAAVNIGVDAVMRGLGFEAEEWGRKYVRRYKDERGKNKEQVIVFSHPANLPIRWFAKTLGSFGEPGDDLMDGARRMVGNMKWDLHPLWRTAASLADNTTMSGDEIWNRNDHGLVKSVKFLEFMTNDIIGIWREVIGPTVGRRLEGQATIDSRNQLAKDIGIMTHVLDQFVFHYSREPRHRQLAAKIRAEIAYLKKTVRQEMYRKGVRRDDWILKAKERIKKLKAEALELQKEAKKKR